MGDYIRVDERIEPKNSFEKFKRFVKNSFGADLLIGLWVVFREMVKKGNSHTLLYPREKVILNDRYRGVHRLLRLLESGNERCIGCGLCEKICVSNCITMQTSLDENDRQKVENYSINLGRCVYCGLCADVCPELAIVHGDEYEIATEQRASFGFKEDFLTPASKLRSQKEFGGYGSLPKDADEAVKFTPFWMQIDESGESKDV